MKTTRQRIVEAAPMEVWSAITPLERTPHWLAGVESVEHTGGPLLGAGRKQRVTKLLYNHDVEIDLEIVAWEPERLLSFRHLRESSGGKALTSVRDFHTTVFLQPEGLWTRVQVEYSWKVSWGLTWLLSLFLAGRVMGGELKSTLNKIELLVSSGK